MVTLIRVVLVIAILIGLLFCKKHPNCLSDSFKKLDEKQSFHWKNQQASEQEIDSY